MADFNDAPGVVESGDGILHPVKRSPVLCVMEKVKLRWFSRLYIAINVTESAEKLQPILV